MSHEGVGSFQRASLLLTNMFRRRLAHPLLLLLLAYQLVAQAADAPSNSPHEEAPANCVDGCSKRTSFNIIWGCLSTTIICAWAAIHPNIPPREGAIKGTLRKLELMFWTIMAPEILPAWALNQLLAAKTVRDVYNEGKGYEQENCGIWKTLKGLFSFYEIKEAASQAWTLKHGHFLIMGGFHLVEPVEGNSTSPEVTTGTEKAALDVANVQSMSTLPVEGTQTDAEKKGAPENKSELEEGRVTILTLEMLRELVKDEKFRIRITEEEITHRSKGDELSKLIFILQSSWFILQCLARYVQGLGLTQLELTTLALASLNAITFILWWHKPLRAQAIVRVSMGRELTDAERGPARRQSERSRLIPGLRTFFGSYESAIRATLLCQSEGNIFVDWLIGLPLIILILLLSPIIVFGFAIFATTADLLGSSTSFPADATHVPTFYVPKHGHSKAFHISFLGAFGVIFGAIHCAGWNLPFPTYAEKQLWRIASLIVTTFPIAAIPIAFIAVLIGLVAFIIIVVTIFLIWVIGVILLLVAFIIAILIALLIEVVVIVITCGNISTGVLDTIGDFDFETNAFDTLVRLITPIHSLFATFSRSDLGPFHMALIFYMLAYASSRLLLLGLALALLGHQPLNAFVAVDWVKFYPHIF